MALGPPEDALDFAEHVCAAGDLDSDGVPDFFVSSPSQIIAAYSGADGTTLWSIRGPFGAAPEIASGAICPAGDVTGDGKADLIVATQAKGPIDWRAWTDWVECWNGTSGIPVWRVQSDEMLDHYPADRVGLAALGDIDDDGVSDFVLASSNRRFEQDRVGALGAYSGRTGKLIYEQLGTASAPLWGDVSSCPDTNGDGIRDFFSFSYMDSESRSENDEGGIALRSGKNGKVLRHLDDGHHNEGNGEDVGELPDLDHDGTPEVAVHYSWTTLLKWEHDKWAFHSARTGAIVRALTRKCSSAMIVKDSESNRLVLWQLTPTALEGRSLETDELLSRFELSDKKGVDGSLIAVGDVDRDGQADLAVALSRWRCRLFGPPTESGEVLMGAELEARVSSQPAALVSGWAPEHGGAILIVTLPRGLRER